MVKYPIIYKGFMHPRWCRISSINQYDKGFTCNLKQHDLCFGWTERQIDHLNQTSMTMGFQPLLSPGPKATLGGGFNPFDTLNNISSQIGSFSQGKVKKIKKLKPLPRYCNHQTELLCLLKYSQFLFCWWRRNVMFQRRPFNKNHA